MRHAAPLLLALAILAIGATGVQGQVTSHWLTNNWPWELLPKYVEDPPTAWTETVAVPLWYELPPAPGDIKVAADAVNQVLAADTVTGTKLGRPDATTLDEMLTAQRGVVLAAQASKWAETVEAGRKLLAMPKETCGDFTWDYLAAATAWACLQTGDYKAAAEAHSAGASAITDVDLKEYHRRRAAAILEAVKGGDRDVPATKIDDLKTPATIDNLLRKGLAEEARQVMISLEKVKTAKTVKIRLSNLLVAYQNLRRIQAIDPVVTQRLLGDFKAAVDSLVTDSAAAVLKQAAVQHDKLVVAERMPMRASAMPLWNSDVRAMWASIAEVKRLCRIHSYLERLGLAGTVDRDTPFKAAHELLYAPPRERPRETNTTGQAQQNQEMEPIAYREVYKIVGTKTAAGIDMMRRGKSLELDQTEPAKTSE